MTVTTGSAAQAAAAAQAIRARGIRLIKVKVGGKGGAAYLRQAPVLEGVRQAFAHSIDIVFIVAVPIAVEALRALRETSAGEKVARLAAVASPFASFTMRAAKARADST